MYESQVSRYSQSGIFPLKSLAFSQISNVNAPSAPGFIHVLCPTHQQYAITNICRSQSCIEPLCPECIPSHIKLHQQSKKTPKIQTIVSARVSCIQRLAEQKFYTQNDLEKLQETYKSNAEKVDENLKKKLQNSKAKVIKLIDKIYDKMNEAVDVIYSAYLQQDEKNQNQLRRVSAPLRQYLSNITMYKTELQSQDFISTLIQVLSEFPKKPEINTTKTKQNFGEVEVFQKNLQQVQKAIQKYVKVTVNCKEPRTNNLLTNKSNNTLFSRINIDKSRSIQSNRKSIFRDSSRSKIEPILSSQQQYNTRIELDLINMGSINITASNYFKGYGILAYCEEKAKHYYVASMNQIQRGFEKKDLNINFLINDQHRTIVTPSNQIFLIGGRNDFSAQNKIYQIRDNTCIELPKMHTQRYNFGACYHNQYIYVAGGYTNSTITNKFQRYDIKKKCWVNLKNCLQNNYACQIISFNQNIIKIGGKTDLQTSINQLQVYDINSDKWSAFQIELTKFKFPTSCGGIQTSLTELLIFGGSVNDIKQNQSFIIQFSGQKVKIHKFLELYTNSNFINPTYIHNKSVIALQGTSKGTTRNIIRTNGNNWKFVSC